MAAANGQSLPPQAGHHQRTKSSVLRSFMMHRRNNSNGDGLAAAPLVASQGGGGGGPLEEMSHNRQQVQTQTQAEKHLISHGAAAGTGANGQWPSEAATSPTKKKKLTRDAPPTIMTDVANAALNVSSESNATAHPPPPLSPTKKTKTRSTTNLVGLLSRPKSLRNLHKLASKDAEAEEEDEERGRGRSRGDEKKRDKSRRNNKEGRDKENRTPPSSVANESMANAAAQAQPMPPIYAQFCSTSKGSGKADLAPGVSGAIAAKPRPNSFHPGSASVGGGSSTPTTRPKLATAFSSTRQMQNAGGSTPATPGVDAPSPSEPVVQPSEIDAHLEALLDRRNIPEQQRYKMRNLANAIKMELIRQDWAEERSKRQQQHQQPEQVERPQSHDSVRSAAGSSDPAAAPIAPPTPTEESSTSKASKSKHSRVKSLTLSKVARGRSRDRGNGDSGKRPKSPGSPLKKKAEGTLGGTLSRHLRSKSTESFIGAGANGGGSSDATSSAAGGTAASSAITGFFQKAKGPPQNSPGDFVTYLRTVQTPEKVEVGKLHKLRLLLRNETVAWIEDFIGQGGMEEVVGLLHRIMAVEWREEHEDALLHENLLCLKALCTTALALQYLHSIHASLLPALIHMIFDPEKKGPSEFTTRNIVTWVLFTYIQNAPIPERPARAQTVLGYLRDPEREEDERPVSFVLEMRKDRPYRVWCKEVVNVTKEVFWIFLHHLNVVSLPASAKAAAKERKLSPSAANEDESSTSESSQASPPLPPKHSEPPSSYMIRHFPQERPPVPAAPYVGGVEWDATNYLASHLDLVNAILACTPTAAERNHLRSLMQMSGWERCMGSSLRLCKEKFYGAVHDGLRVWVAAAYEDGWDVRDVRYGPPPPPATPSAERRSNSPNKKTPAVGGPKADEPAPKLEIPKLDFILDGEDL